MATYSIKGFEKKLRNWAKTNPKEIKIALKKGTEIVRTEVVQNHLSGPKMPRGVGSRNNATLRRISGDLAGSINTKVIATKKRISGIIGTNMDYAEKHEKGIGVPLRPFLAPSLAKRKKAALKLILKHMMLAYKKARAT